MSLVAQTEVAARQHQELRFQLRAIVSGCGAYRLNRTLVSLAGKDRTRWLNGMVSNNIRDLAPGHGVYAFVLNPQGQIQGDLYAFNRAESLILDVDRAQPNLLPQLRRYLIMDKVDVEELGDRVAVFGVAGPGSDRAFSQLGLPAPVAALEFAEATWNGVSITIIRGDNPCIPTYQFWVPNEHAEQFWNAWLHAGATAVHDAALETFRIVCGLPKLGSDIRERTLPQETAQDRALNFNKGCYIGQEIVERIRARGSVHRVLTGFEVNGPAPPSGTAIQADGKDAGLITSSATVPTRDGDRTIALGFMRREHLSGDVALTAAGVKIVPVSLPFSSLMQRL